nr:TPA: DnaJ domain containing protein, related [Neospora caninum Liverpool]
MWPLVCFLVGGAAFAARGGLRQAAIWRQGKSASGGSGTQADVAEPLRQWFQAKFGAAGVQWRALTRDLRGFENPMSKTEAFQILRLSPTATKEKILQTHKQLMLRNHPDNGGSTYMATKVNEAKEKLLKERR